MAVSGSYKVAFSPDLTEFKGIGDDIRKDLAKATAGLPADFEKLLREITSDLKGLKGVVKGNDVIDDDGFKEAGDDAGRAFSKGLDDEVTKGSSGIAGKLGGILGGAGKAAAAGVAGAAAGLGALAFSGIKATAELQQSMGGTEAVFGENADSIKKWAAQAAGSMGITTNSALETATNMGSLFQGSGFSAEKSAEMSMAYAQRAADVASVRGLDLASAMEAVSGAAKGNFEMMDNLGVPMDNAKLNAYALSKGMDKTFESMNATEKAGLAYEMFMEKSAYAAGNFEKENESLAGSFDILKASWGNVLSSMADPAMLEASLATFSESLTKFVGSVSEVLPMILTGVVTIIQQLLPVLLKTLTDLIPLLTTLLTDGLPQIVDAILEAMPGLIEALLGALNSLLPLVLDLIVDIVLKIVEMLPGIIEGLLALVITLIPVLLEALGTIVIAIVQMLPELIVMIVQAIVDLIPVLLEGAIALFLALLEALPIVILEIIKVLPTLIAELVTALVSAIPQIISGGIQLFMGLLEALPVVILEIVKALPQILESLVDGISDAGNAIVEGLWNGIKEAWPLLMKSIGKLLSGLWEAFLDFFDIHSPSRLMRDSIGKNIGLGVGEGIEDSIGSALKSVGSFNEGIYAEFEDGSMELLAPADMGTSTVDTSGSTPVVNQYIQTPAPKGLGDIARAARRGAISGINVVK